jgi:hypothetical protein
LAFSQQTGSATVCKSTITLAVFDDGLWARAAAAARAAAVQAMTSRRLSIGCPALKVLWSVGLMPVIAGIGCHHEESNMVTAGISDRHTSPSQGQWRWEIECATNDSTSTCSSHCAHC